MKLKKLYCFFSKESSNSTLCTTCSEAKRRSLFQDVKRRILATGYRYFETVYGTLFQESNSLSPLKKIISIQSRNVGYNLPPNPHNFSEELRPRAYGDKSLKSPLQDTALFPHVVFHTF